MKPPSRPADRPAPDAPQWQPGSGIDLAAQQLLAVERFDRARRMREEAAAAAARTDNGADAVGLVVAEQPDLVLVEDTARDAGSLEVVREIREFSPQTLVTAQAAHGGRVGQLLDAWATTVSTRQIPPHDVVRSLLQLVGA